MKALIETQAHHSDLVFKDVNLECGDLVSSDFYDCEFVHCNFVETVFHKCRFVNCVFQHCDLSLVRVPDSTFSSTRFKDSKLIGINWAQAHWSSAGLRDSVGFFKSAISHSTFFGLNLKSLQVKDCLAWDVDFREADLSNADFAGTDLSESMFVNTDLTKADLSRARNYHIDPGQNILRQARFSLPEAMSLLYSLDIVLVDGG